MDRDILLLLVGASIALVSSLLTALIQHILSLRADQVRRERDREDRKVEELRKALSDGTRPGLSEVRDKIAQRKLAELYEQARLELRAGDWEVAVKAFESVLQEASSGTEEEQGEPAE